MSFLLYFFRSLIKKESTTKKKMGIYDMKEMTNNK